MTKYHITVPPVKIWDKTSVNAVNTLLHNKSLYWQKLKDTSRHFALQGDVTLTLSNLELYKCTVLWGCHFINDLYIFAVAGSQGKNIYHIICQKEKKQKFHPLAIAEEWLHINLYPFNMSNHFDMSNHKEDL